jgi:DNA-binding MarR family transcriptional regulator
LALDPIAEAHRNWTEHGWGDAADGMAFVTSVVRVHQLLLARIDQTLDPFDLSFARFELLMLLLFTRKGELPLGKIGVRLQVHPASVTNAVNRLESQGLVVRRPHPDDGRTTLARITPAGRRVARRAADALNAAVFTEPGLPSASATRVVAAFTALRRDAGDFAVRG